MIWMLITIIGSPITMFCEPNMLSGLRKFIIIVGSSLYRGKLELSSLAINYRPKT